MFTLTDTAPRSSLFDFPAPAGAVIGRAFDDALESNPVPMFMLAREINAARERGPKMPAAEAQQRAQQAGVKVKVPEDGITAEALQYLIERRRDDAERQLLFSRSPGGAATAGQFAAGFAGALMDPVNVALGFVPVLGGTRYAGVLAEAGTAAARAGVRLGVGAAEGAVGAVLTEIPTLNMRRELQDEYSLYDSLANIAFGTAASAGIRGVSGAARDAVLGIQRARQVDALRAIEPEVWADLKARADNAQARAFWSDLEVGFQRGEGIPPELAAAFERDRYQGEFHQGLDDYRAERQALVAAADAAIERRMARERETLLAAGMEPDEALREAFRRAHPETERLLKSQAEIGADRMSEIGLADARERIASGKGLVLVPGTPRGILGAISDTTHAHALRAAVAQAIEGKRIDVDPVVRSDPIFGAERMGEAAVRARARAADDPGAKVGADKGASQRAALQLVESRARPKTPAKPAEGATPEPPPSPERAEAEALLAETRAELDAKPVIQPMTMQERLGNKDIREEFTQMKRDTGWAEVGGRMIRAPSEDGMGEVVGRTMWIPRADWWPGRPKGLTEKQVEKAIDKALAGEPLNVPERRIVNYMLEIAEARLRAEGWTAKPDELLAEGLGKGDAFDGKLAARAAALDPDAFERLAIETENDDAAFLRGVKEILDAHDAANPSAKAGQPGQAGERATGEGSEGAAGAEAQSPEVKQGDDLAAAFKAAGDCAVRRGQ